MSTLQHLTNRGLIKPPRWLPGNVQYETIMGSVAYGVSSDTSDVDVYGWAIPPKDDLFAHLRGEVPGFGTPRPRFEQYQEHHVEGRDALAGHGRTYDLTIYGIVKFFNLAMESNPNVIDSLFTPVNCILHSTRVGNLVRENRRLFLHKGAWPKFKGYAYSQLHKISIKTPQGKRVELVEKHGYDVKFAYHVVRLITEVEMILMEQDIDLQGNNEQLKAIRRGEWTEERLRKWCADKESDLERIYAESKLRAVPDEQKIRALLLNALEDHYGSLKGCIVNPDRAVEALRNIQAELERVKHLLMSDQVTTEAMERLRGVVTRHPYPLVFATISGAHLYGLPSPDSDDDLQGCHVLPVREVVGLDAGRETIETSSKDDGFELDLVTHDAKKFFGLLLRKNGYVLEQVYSPLIVHTTPEHEELKQIAQGCVTRHHSHHYFGFAETQWKLFEKERPRRVKPLLYVYRVLLTGIHLMRTGVVQANLVRLNEEAQLAHVTDLIARKLAGPEESVLDDTDLGVTTGSPLPSLPEVPVEPVVFLLHTVDPKRFPLPVEVRRSQIQHGLCPVGDPTSPPVPVGP